MMFRLVLISIVVLLSLPLLAACRITQGQSPDESKKSLKLISSSFNGGERIPLLHTCDGDDVSPHLIWEDLPENAQSLVIIMDDPDAPVGTFVHWVLYDIDVTIEELPQGVSGIGVAGVNGFRKTGYGGPCPPRGSEHHYHFKLYALDSALELGLSATKEEVERAMRGHILAWGELVGLYSR